MFPLHFFFSHQLMNVFKVNASIEVLVIEFTGDGWPDSLENCFKIAKTNTMLKELRLFGAPAGPILLETFRSVLCDGFLALRELELVVRRSQQAESILRDIAQCTAIARGADLSNRLSLTVTWLPR